MISTLRDATTTTVKRQIGTESVDLIVPRSYETYGNKMYGVDKGDQKRAHFGGFANRAHFHKWYKKANFGLEDIKLANGHTAWTLSVPMVPNRNHLN